MRDSMPVGPHNSVLFTSPVFYHFKIIMYTAITAQVKATNQCNLTPITAAEKKKQQLKFKI